MATASPELPSESETLPAKEGPFAVANLFAVYRRLLWLFGGGDTKVLIDCPRRDQAKFDLLGAINLMIALVVAFTMFRWTSISLAENDLRSLAVPESYIQHGGVQSVPLPVEKGRSHVTIATAVGCLAFLLSLIALAAANRLFAMRYLGPIAGIAMVVQLPVVVATVGALISHYRITPPGEFYSLISLLAWGLSSGEYIKRTWKSLAYDEALALANDQRRFDPATKAPAPAIKSAAALSDATLQRLLKLEEYLSKTLEENPKDTVTALKLARIWRNLGKLSEAAKLLDAFINIEANNVEILATRAELYKAMGDDVRARRTLERVDEIHADAAFEENVGKEISLRSFEMHDLDFFGDFKWEFQPQVAVLLGRNGYGKSFLLRSLVAMLQNDQKITEKFFKNSRSSPFIQVDITKDGKPDFAKRSRLVFDHEFGKVPVLAIPDMRYIDKSGETIGLTRDEMTDLRSQGAWHFLREQPYEGMIIKLLYGLCLDYLEAKDPKRPFDQPIFQLMQDTVAKLTGSNFQFAQIVRKEHEFQLNVLTEGNTSPLPLQKASQGTLSVLTMFGLVFRYLGAIHKHVSDHDLVNQKGIVIIDEIDAHLHPAWQQKILQLFRNTFPNVQFIVTAHSPLVVAGCKKHEVAVLRKNSNGFGVETLADHFIGATSDEIYRKVFQIEDKDPTYLSLNTLSSEKPLIEKKLASLEHKAASAKLSAQEDNEMVGLKENLFYLRQFEEVKSTRRQSEQFQVERQSLQLKFIRSQGEIAALKKDLDRFQNPEADAEWKKFVSLAGDLRQNDELNHRLLQSAASAFALSGRTNEAVRLLEIILRASPGDLESIKSLAVYYQSLGQFGNALAKVNDALRVSPANTELQQMRLALMDLVKDNQPPATAQP